MKVTNHRLVGVNQMALTPNHGGALTGPTLLVIHYTASGGTGKADADYLSKAAAKASAHIVVGRAGLADTHQIAPFDIKTWHAGVSVWRGKSNCNDYSIGIEVDNYGWCLKAKDYSYRPGANQALKLDKGVVVEARHKNPACPYGLWEIYPKEQMDALIEVTNAILEAYPSIKEIVGHEDIAPGRKTDPGPAFPWSNFLANTIGRKAKQSVSASVTASSLNVRGGPGAQYPVIGELKHGAPVQIIYDVPGDWAEISYVSGEDIKAGFVADRYLAKK